MAPTYVPQPPRADNSLSHFAGRVGKTSLMNQYVNKKFSSQYKATIGAVSCGTYSPAERLQWLLH